MGCLQCCSRHGPRLQPHSHLEGSDWHTALQGARSIVGEEGIAGLHYGLLAVPQQARS